MSQNTIASSQESSFNVHDKKKRKVVFSLNGNNVTTSCTCNEVQPCDHVLYVAAGRKNKISQNERNSQKELILALSKTGEGKAVLHKAQLHFDHEMTCRACESERVIDTKKSWLGPFYKLFMRRGLRYHCRRCGWNW